MPPSFETSRVSEISPFSPGLQIGSDVMRIRCGRGGVPANAMWPVRVPAGGAGRALCAELVTVSIASTPSALIDTIAASRIIIECSTLFSAGPSDPAVPIVRFMIVERLLSFRDGPHTFDNAPARDAAAGVLA